MKVLRVKEKEGYSSFVVDYCCDPMHLVRGSFGFNHRGEYCLLMGTLKHTAPLVRFCPFCGEKIEIEREFS